MASPSPGYARAAVPSSELTFAHAGRGNSFLGKRMQRDVVASDAQGVEQTDWRAGERTLC
jgi:hypothetical protein